MKTVMSVLPSFTSILGRISSTSRTQASLKGMSWGGSRWSGHRGRQSYTEDGSFGQNEDGKNWGRGNWRGARWKGHRGRRYYSGARDSEGGERFHQQQRNYNQDRDVERRGGGRPHGLRGREIGMYYAARSKAKKERQEVEERPMVSMEDHEERKIRKMLDQYDEDEMRHGKSSSQAHLKQKRPSSASSLFVEESKSEIASISIDQDEDFEEVTLHIPTLSEIKECSEDIGEIVSLEDVDFSEEMEGEESQVQGDISDQIFQIFQKQLFDKKQDPQYKEMQKFRKKLPAYKLQKDIVDLVHSNQVIVLSGETGCGKTTQVPQFILDDYLERGDGSSCRIICTQPRRISAISVAERVARERAENVKDGGSVGYSIRFERFLPRRSGSILFCTSGILLKYLESDPMLKSTSHIIIDEIHERDLLSDFLMIVVKDLLPLRPELRVILMSATLNAEQFSEYFNNCPSINIPGYTFPVEEHYLEDVLEKTGYRPNAAQKKRPKHGWKNREKQKEMEEAQWNINAWARNLPEDKYSPSTVRSLQEMDREKIDYELIVELIRYIDRYMGDGAILVFVPGWTDISNVNKLLADDKAFSWSRARVIPLHSLMPTVNQREVFERPPQGVRKIVIATNIAETSITIDDVVFVIDCGKIKVTDFEPTTGLLTLDNHWVSKANAQQRRGRAGRVQAGHCFHLFTTLQKEEMREYLPPEILRTRLEELCLRIKILKMGKIEPFVKRAMDIPSMESINKAIQTLQDLNALDDDEELLPLGYHLAKMPIEPHIGKMILMAAMLGCLEPVCIVAASLSFKDPFLIPLGKEKAADRQRMLLAGGCKSDHILLIKAFKGWQKAKARGYGKSYCYDNFLSENTLCSFENMKKQFAELLNDMGFTASRDPDSPLSNVNSGNEKLITAVICAGLYPNVAKIQTPAKKRGRYIAPPKVTLKNGQRAELFPKSVNCETMHFESKWLIYHKVMRSTKVYIYDCSMLSPYPLLFFGGKISSSVTIDNNEEQDVVTVDDWITFWTKQSTIDLVKDLRRQFNRILKDKVTSPSVIRLDGNSREAVIMNAIISLITKEEIEYLNSKVDLEDLEDIDC